MAKMNPSADDVKISVVVPLFNEEGSLVELHRRLAAALCTLEKPVEILFIDDGSSDASFEVLKSIRAKDANVRALQFLGEPPFAARETMKKAVLDVAW